MFGRQKEKKEKTEEEQKKTRIVFIIIVAICVIILLSQRFIDCGGTNNEFVYETGSPSVIFSSEETPSLSTDSTINTPQIEETPSFSPEERNTPESTVSPFPSSSESTTHTPTIALSKSENPFAKTLRFLKELFLDYVVVFVVLLIGMIYIVIGKRKQNGMYVEENK